MKDAALVCNRNNKKIMIRLLLVIAKVSLQYTVMNSLLVLKNKKETKTHLKKCKPFYSSLGKCLESAIKKTKIYSMRCDGPGNKRLYTDVHYK